MLVHVAKGQVVGEARRRRKREKETPSWEAMGRICSTCTDCFSPFAALLVVTRMLSGGEYHW
jgi:hypothetical protein